MRKTFIIISTVRRTVMKKYETLIIQINECADVVATSAEVTTEKILFPWSNNTLSGYSVNRNGTPPDGTYEVERN